MSAAAKELKPQPAEPLNIYQRINEVRKVVNYARKEKEVTGQGYKAVTHDAVTALVRNHLIKHGVLIVPRLLDSSVETIGQTKNGSPVIRYAARFEIDFINCDTPEDRITLPIEAHANDHGDKAPGKAVSYATKYAILKLFNIETGEDEESRVEPYGGHPKLTGEQTKELRQKITDAGADEKAFCDYLKVEDLEQLRADHYQTYLDLVEAKRRQNERKAKKAE